MIIQFPATLIAIITATVALVVGNKNISWIVPLLIANSLTGAVYMVREDENLSTVGTGVLGTRIKTKTHENILINILLHGLIPIFILSKINWKSPFNVKYAIMTEVIGLAVIDVSRTYPSQNGMQTYIFSHILFVICFTVAISHTIVKQESVS